MHKITNVTVLHNYKLKLEYDDGRQGIVDLSHLAGKGVFSLWNDYDVFRKVKIGSSGELVWNDLVDLCPDSLYLKLTNQKHQELLDLSSNGQRSTRMNCLLIGKGRQGKSLAARLIP